jgi:hypothetical protein
MREIKQAACLIAEEINILKLYQRINEDYKQLLLVALFMVRNFVHLQL